MRPGVEPRATDDARPARDGADVRALAATAGSLDVLDARIVACRACPRLVAWREEVARTRRRAFAGQPYWGRPVTGFGDRAPAILVVGLAPAAHGANRTGRVFTGDRSGDWLFASLHRVGVADRPGSVAGDDGMTLAGVRLTAAVRCAPPANRPEPSERNTCAPWLHAELAAVSPGLRGVVALGGFAWGSVWRALAACGWPVPRPRPALRPRGPGRGRVGHGRSAPVRIGCAGR